MDLVTEEFMMNKENDGPAFPIVHPDGSGVQYYGMTLRDYFAVRATEQDIENHRAYKIDPQGGPPIYTMTVEQGKYAYADAMLAARSQS